MNAMQQVKQWAVRLCHVDENSKATDIGLLIIRIAVCVCLIYHHGAEKFYDFDNLAHRPWLDPIGIGVVPSMIFAGFADGICALLVLLGLYSRFASFFCLICLNTVWWLMNHGLQHLLGLPIPPPVARTAQVVQASAQHIVQAVHSMPNFMNVPMYILGFLVIFIAGPGRYSFDKTLETRRQKKAQAGATASAA
jgi:uncharacterized membrane protein YphA (DoxX/SURF4 family)